MSRETPVLDRNACKKRFYRLVYPSHPNEWEVDDVMSSVSRLGGARQALLFDQVEVIWPISHSLCLTFLEEASQLDGQVPGHLVPEWVRTILNRYETEGLAGARKIISHVQETFLEPLKARNLVRFEHISARMALFIRGVSGLPFELVTGDIPSCDTRSIRVMDSLSLFPARRQNVLFYKFLISLHYGFVLQGTYRKRPSFHDISQVQSHFTISPAVQHELRTDEFFALFPDPQLARDLYFIAELRPVMAWLKRELPGLYHQFQQLGPDLKGLAAGQGARGMTEQIMRRTLAALFDHEGVDSRPGQVVEPALSDREPARPGCSSLLETYLRVQVPGTLYHRSWLLDLLGRHDFERAELVIKQRREEAESTFVMQLAEILKKSGAEDNNPPTGSDSRVDQAVVRLVENTTETGVREKALVINNESCTIPDDLAALIQEIEQDLGEVPQGYFSAASGIAGGGLSRGGDNGTDQESGNSGGTLLFDEWDHRRNGYRRGWCTVIEKEFPLLRSSFVPATLQKHSGLLTRIKRQFEMMRLTDRFVGRQRDGDNFDLDAVVEARGDRRAGTVATDQLFIRLLRDERDIVTLFLVDMSNSTEGWVGTVIKEALVLLCEAMEVIGDTYGIYGFSGMRRSRCEIFPIKHPSDPYNESIPRKIGSIMPRDYTRLGPAIRYATRQLGQCDARMRLLVMITDGKPEDYDDYKGEYAIEDTRKALLEARGEGLKTFCITVDRQAHDYLPHMYGRGNYVFVDDIEKLPFRLIDMYRLLTA